MYGFVGNDGTNKWDVLGLVCKQIPGSWKWIENLKIVDVKLKFRVIGVANTVTGNLTTEFESATVKWKGRAQVSCECCNRGIVDAAGDIIGESEDGAGTTYVYPILNKVVTPISGLGLGDLVAIGIDYLAGEIGAPPTGVIDSANTWGTMMDEIVDLSEEPKGKNLKWANRRKNPCQALVDNL